MLKIRPHHLFCLLGFKGMGYNKTFVDNMSRISSYLKENPDDCIKLVIAGDDICARCPHLLNWNCGKTSKTEASLKHKENLILSRIGVKPGENIKINDAYRLIKENITIEMFDIICGSCQWYRDANCRKNFENFKGSGLL